MINASVGTVGTSIDSDNQCLKPVPVIHMADDFSEVSVGKGGVFGRRRIESNVIGNDVGPDRRKAFEQRRSIVTVELPSCYAY